MNSFFLQGLQHPLLSPAQLIVLIALSVLLGQQGWKHLTGAGLTFILAVSGGLALTRYTLPPAFNTEAVLLTVSCITALLIILKLNLPLWITTPLAIVTGILTGIYSAPVIIPGLKAAKVYMDMAGSLTSVGMIMLLASLIAMPVNQLGNGIALRVLGSWIFASALMVLALIFAPVKM